MLNGSRCILLDADFSAAEMRSLGLTGDTLGKKYANRYDPENRAAIDFRSAPARFQNWRLTLFTSGTTGQPKKVQHTFRSITRSVKTGPDRRDDIWGLAYNPTHMAGLQVFFQALLNHNTIVNIFKLSRAAVLDTINRYGITNMSATPTYYRLLLPFEAEFPTVKRLTSGGERFDPHLMEHMRKVFPNAKLLNVYASTEAGTLFAAGGEHFTIEDPLREFVKIENGELLVHRDKMAQSDDLILEGEWYFTGDRVEIVAKDPLVFRFVCRKDEMINVAGYMVNPQEVERVLNRHPKIRASRVYGKPHVLTGNVLLCDVQSAAEDVTEKELRAYLSAELQEFKIPRMFRFVESIEATRTGKIRRN
jgi:acyl-coenzyme A synthetase/AMP-(fatty) acid ligase